MEYTRRVEGILTPLGFPVLQGAFPFLCVAHTHVLTVRTDVAPLTEHRPIATLAHKLDRVLFKYVHLLSCHPAFSSSL